MALTRSQIVPMAFWFGFIALGLVTSFGAPHKPRATVRATHQSITAPVKPDRAAIALDAGSSSRRPGDGAIQNGAAQED